MRLAPVLHLGTAAEIDAALEGLVQQNVVQRRALLAPALRDARHVRYQREPPGRERWQSAAETNRRGLADCEDLACWVAADLRVAGISDARAITIPTGPNLRHCVVQVRGLFFDPSRARGMKGPG